MIISFFPVATNTLAGLKSVAVEKKDLMFSYAAKKSAVYFKLMIPASVASLLTGMKIAAPLAITASIIVDTLSGAAGLGYLITHSLYAGNVLTFWASVVISAVLGILAYSVIGLAERLVMPYKFNSVFKKRRNGQTEKEKA
jgi:NitT/TauT family transport system permease protein